MPVSGANTTLDPPLDFLVNSIICIAIRISFIIAQELKFEYYLYIRFLIFSSLCHPNRHPSRLKHNIHERIPSQIQHHLVVNLGNPSYLEEYHSVTSKDPRPLDLAAASPVPPAKPLLLRYFAVTELLRSLPPHKLVTGSLFKVVGSPFPAFIGNIRGFRR